MRRSISLSTFRRTDREESCTKAGGRTENPKYVTSSVAEIELPRVFSDGWLIQTRELGICSGRDRTVEKNPILGRVIGVST